ncbi:FtsX-like permease family protein [Roseivirga sp.]|uniref:FtsX-like permease family protein n=1 Tax=Roseivirga sp. TaxID=1964215 RepID=UPI003B8D8C95
MNNQLPKYWTKLFSWFCNDQFAEELQGDLEERFYRNTEKLGSKKAKLIYKKEVIKMIRPSVIGLQKKIPMLIRASILKIHFILAIRNMVRNKTFSVVNIFGLGAAIAVSLFIVNLLYTGYQLDRHHRDAERIYRVSNYVEASYGKNLYAASGFPLSDLVRESIPDFEYVTHVNNSFKPKFKINGVDIPLKGLYTDENFFEIFSFKTITGDPNSIFDDINSVIITDKVAERLFPDEEPIGKVTEDGFIVRAIIESSHGKSHIPFDAITSIASFKSTMNQAFKSWQFHYQDFTYVKLMPGLDPIATSEKLKVIAKDVNALPSESKEKFEFKLQPVVGIVFAEQAINELGPAIGKEGVYIFTALILIMVLIASFNYTNLSIARAIQRTKEVGIRKVVGSTKWQIINQFLLETLIFSMLGLLIGFFVYRYFSSTFLEVVGDFSATFQTTLDTQIILVFVLFSVITGLLAGVFPAIYFSKIKPLSLFKTRDKSKKLSFHTLRKLLVGFQLTLSMFVLIFVTLIVEQRKSVLTTSLGFDQKGLLVIDGIKGDSQILLDEFRKISEVEAAGITTGLPGISASGAMLFKDAVSNDSTIMVNFMLSDNQFADVFAPEISRGTGFSESTEYNGFIEVLINESFISTLSLNKENIIGETVKNHGITYKVVGLLDGISGGDVFSYDKPALMVANRMPANRGKIIIRTSKGRTKLAIKKMEAAWDKVYPEDRFQPKFYQDIYESAFSSFTNLIRILGFLGLCIISISLLGQLGMALYNAETRVKEIGIRKVLGAKMRQIIKLLLKNTVVTLSIAALIASPLAYQLFATSFMGEINTPFKPTVWIFLKAILGLTVIVAGLVSTLTWRTARVNPSESLRNE